MRTLRLLGLVAGLGVCAPSLASEPVLLAPVVPASSDDAGVADVVENQTRERLLSDGWVVLDAETVAPVVNATALDACATEPIPCAQGVLVGLPIRLAIAARLDRIGDTLIGHVEIVAPGGAAPLATVNVPVVPGNEHLFALEVSRLASQATDGMDPASADLLAAAARLIAGPDPAMGSGSGSATPVAPVAPASAPAPAGRDRRASGRPEGRAPARSPSAGPPPVVGDTVEERIEGTGVRKRRLAGSVRHFMKSGMDPRDYLYRAMPHAGQLILEARAGFGMGDVDRQVLLRIEEQEGALNNAWYREGPAAASNFQGSAYIGFAPVTVLDIGVLVGFQYANRVYDTGTITLDNLGDFDRRMVRAPDVVQALDIIVQPRLRLYVVPVGPAKPYIVGGAELKVFNDYQGNDTFIVPAGGWIQGAVGGGGVLIDPGPVVGLFAEGTYARHFGDRSATITGTSNGSWDWADGEDPPAASNGATVAITGGVQFRL